MSKPESSDLTGAGENGPEPIIDYPDSLATLNAQGFCPYGQYPWDFWEKRALARGVDAGLATLGRAAMREAYQHQWEAKLRTLCGWEDEGEAMIGIALSMPEQARYIWEKLLETDGCRGSRNSETGEWISWM